MWSFYFNCRRICGYFRDKRLIHILVVATYLPVRLTPKIFHLSVSHRKFLANYGVYIGTGNHRFFFCLRRISSKYPRKFLDSICGPFRDKVMRMYDVANAGRSGTALCVLPQKKPHSKNTQSNRFSSNYHRKLCCLYRNRKSSVPFLFVR